ncbi:MAG: VTT domain-containing protein [Desulfotomaculaceae bacterium]|nr:VTT domain-containing protein [Desulfotomaculaceae bacterium]
MEFYNYTHVIAYVNQFGAYAPLVFFLLFVIQAMLPVFPYVILAAAGGFLFGFQQGILLAWSGALSGASLAYWICRWFGIGSFLNKYYLRYGYDEHKLSPWTAFWTIIIARVIPVVPTPLINVAAALGGVSFPTFLLASAIGKIPAAVLYTGLGLALFQAQDVKTILFIIAAGISIMILARYAAGQWRRQKLN